MTEITTPTGTDSVEALTARIGRLVHERQALRAASAGADLLEENRRQIAALQLELSRALIARYLPAAA